MSENSLEEISKHTSLNITFWTSVNVNFRPMGAQRKMKPQDNYSTINLKSASLGMGAVMTRESRGKPYA